MSYEGFSTTNMNFLEPSRPLPAPVPVSGSFDSQPSAGHNIQGSRLNLFTAPEFDPTEEQLFPPGVVADIEKKISKQLDDGMIGLEYIIEIRHNTVKTVPHNYACLLCNITTKISKEMNGVNMMMMHIKSTLHKMAYIERFFPTAKAQAIGSVRAVDHDIVKSVSQKIYQFYGKVSVKIVVGQKLYKRKSAEIKTMIDNSTHFRENDEFLRSLLGSDYLTSKQVSPRGSRSRSPAGQNHFDSRKAIMKHRRSRSRTRSRSRSRKINDNKMTSRTEKRQSSPQDRHSKSSPRRSGSAIEKYSNNKRSRSPREHNTFKRKRSGSPREKLSERSTSGYPGTKTRRLSSPKEYYSEKRRSGTYTEHYLESPRKHDSELKRPNTFGEHHSHPRRSGSPREHYSEVRRPRTSRERQGGSLSCERSRESSKDAHYSEQSQSNFSRNLNNKAENNERDLDERISEFLRQTELEKRKLSDEIYHFVQNPGNHEDHASQWLSFYDAKCKKHLKRINPGLLQEEWKKEWSSFLEYNADKKYRRFKEKLLLKQNIFIRDVEMFLQRRHQKEKSQEKMAVNEENIGPTVYGTLRHLVAIEECLGELGTELLQYLPRAKDLESKKGGGSSLLLESPSFHQLFVSIKSTLQIKLATGDLHEKNADIFVRCLKGIHLILGPTRVNQPTSSRAPSDFNNDDVDILNMVRKAITDDYLRSGRTIENDQLEELVQKEYLRIKTRPISSDTRERGNQESEVEQSLGSPALRMNSSDANTDDQKSSSDTKNQMEGLSINELESLLKNFQSLETSVQNKLICYMKKLEEENPKMVETLKAKISIS